MFEFNLFTFSAEENKVVIAANLIKLSFILFVKLDNILTIHFIYNSYMGPWDAFMNTCNLDMIDKEDNKQMFATLTQRNYNIFILSTIIQMFIAIYNELNLLE